MEMRFGGLGTECWIQSERSGDGVEVSGFVVVDGLRLPRLCWERRRIHSIIKLILIYNVTNTVNRLHISYPTTPATAAAVHPSHLH